MPPKLGEILICAKIIDQHQLESALSAQQRWGGKLGEILVNSGLCSEEMMVKALSRQLDIVRAELDHIAAVPAEVLRRIPLELSLALDALPLELRDNETLLVVAMSDPLNAQAIEALTEKTRCRIHALLAGPHAIARSRARLYQIDEAGADLAEAPLKALAGARGKSVVRGASEYVNKLVCRDALDLSHQGALSSRPPAIQPAPRSDERALGEEADAVPPPDRAAAEALAVLSALVETLIAKGVFAREEFEGNLRAIKGR